MKKIFAVDLRKGAMILGILFIFSGAAGLLAEQSFEKLLANLVGASTPAAAIVLSIYFLGLTLGAWLYARYRRTDRNPLRIYSLLEAGVAIWSILLLLFHKSLIQLMVPVLRLGLGHFWVLEIQRFIVAIIWILPPTILMGATFPTVIAALEGLRIPRPRQTMSRFYTMNLLGAIGGAIAGPYWCFPSLGLGGTLGFTFFLDGLVAFIAWILAGKLRMKDAGRSLKKTANDLSSGVRSNLTLMILAFFSGFILFALEVVWTHLIGVTIGNSVYAFAAMLALVLIGLGLGSALSTVVFKESKPRGPITLVAILFSGAGLIAWQYIQWPQTPFLFVLWGANLATFGQGELLRWILTGRLLLPPTIILGMFYPALFRMNRFPILNRARVAALMGAFNSTGCVLGALMTGFVLIPFWGSAATLMFLSFGIALMALILSYTFLVKIGRWTGVIVSLGFLLLLPTLPGWDWLQLTSGNCVYFRPSHVKPSSRLLFLHEDLQGGITTVVANPNNPQKPKPGDFYKVLLTNGKFQANDAGEIDAQKGFVTIPALHVRSFDDALVIGLGSGQSAASVLRFGFKRMDIAEIASGIVQAAKTHFIHINEKVLDKPNVNLILDDGRNYLLLTNKRYDLISMEISSIWFAGSTNLYSQDFYYLVKKHLKPGGIFQQWIQIHHIGPRELVSVIGTLQHSFQYVSFWVFGSQGILVAGEEPQKLQWPVVQRLIKTDLWSDRTEERIRARIRYILGSRLLAPEETRKMLDTWIVPINTDLNRFLEYASPKYNLVKYPLETMNIKALAHFSTSPPFLTQDWPEIEEELLKDIPSAFQNKPN